MKQTLTFGLTLLVFGIIGSFLTSQIANAYDTSGIADLSLVKNIAENAKKQSELVTESTNKNNSQNDAKTSEKNDNATPRQNRFNANQIKKCETNQDKISTMLDTISNRGTKQLDLFHSIATRVKDFYFQKGYTADGYDQLTNQLDTLYDKSLVAVTASQNASDAWSCNVQDPIASFDTFKNTKHEETTTLKAYKDKVNELILLVKKTGEAN